MFSLSLSQTDKIDMDVADLFFLIRSDTNEFARKCFSMWHVDFKFTVDIDFSHETILIKLYIQ
jgi:hypothetical protein